jgi:hypothetical protein
VAHDSGLARILVRFHPGRILGGFPAGDAPSLFRLEDGMQEIHPDDNFQREDGINWAAIAFYGGYMAAFLMIVRCCW